MRVIDTAYQRLKYAGHPVLVLIAALLAVPAAHAQHGVELSARADFSTNDRLFAESDVIHIRITPGTRLDLTSVGESRVRFEPVQAGDEYEDVLTIREDGTFSGRVEVADLEGDSPVWLLRVNIEDGFGNAFEVQTAVVIHGRAEVHETFIVHGLVESASATHITVGEREFTVTAETEMYGAGGSDPEPGDLIGRRVTVVAEGMDGGSATARRIIEHPESSLRFAGTVEAISASSITLSGITFELTDQTVIRTVLGHVLAASDLQTGISAIITAHERGGAWLAAEITVRSGISEDDDEHELQGRVEVVADASIMVAGMTFLVTNETEFEGADGLTDVSVGSFVELTFASGEDGSPVALSIEVDEDGDEADEIEVEGVITATTDHSITVEGIEIIITSDTKIEGDGHSAVEFGDLNTGLYVEVEGRIETDGSVRATKIKIDDHSDRDVLVIRGEIADIQGEAVTIGETTFLVTDDTRIDGERGARLALEDVESGMYARAHLRAAVDGELTADRLKVEHRFESDDVMVAGRIESVTATAITVQGITFEITAETGIEDVRGNALTVPDLDAGQTARIEGRRMDDGHFVAAEIRVRARSHDEGRFAGVVTAVDAERIEINGASFAVAVETIVKGVASFGMIEVGDRVELRYRLLGDGSRLALRIRVRAALETNTELSGIVDRVHSGAVVVAHVSVYLTAATQVRDEEGRPMAGAALETGQMVTIRGTSTAAGVVAANVDVKDAVVVSGAVSTKTSERIVVAGAEYGLDEQTLIVGHGNAELTREVLSAGTYVEIIATRKTSGGSSKMGNVDQLNAERVLVMQTSAATASEYGDVSVPEVFTLLQNYPNPFNPTTAITFEVADAGDREVSLAIFDVLGRKVRTLVRASLSPGAYTYTWNGNDDAGHPVATGIYLYRLEVGEYAATRSMTLIK